MSGKQSRKLLGIVVAALLLAAGSRAGETVWACIASTGFSGGGTCSEQTTGLGQCRMCCTAIANCRLWFGNVKEKHMAPSEESAGDKICASDFAV